MPTRTKVSPRKEGFPGQRQIILPPSVSAKARKHPVARDLFPTRVGHYPNAEGHYVSRSTGFGEWILIYSYSGKGWCRFEHQRWRLEPDTVLLIPPDTPHTYATTRGSPWSIYWVHLVGQCCPSYWKAMGLTREQPTLGLRHEGRIMHYFEELYHLLEQGQTSATLLAQSTALANVLGGMAMQKRSGKTDDPSTEHNVRSTVDFMRRNLSGSPTLEKLADYARLSIPQYSTVFRKHYGVSPVAFFLELKMRYAAEQLTRPDQKIKDLAEQLGYRDPYYFSRVFKKVMGESPRFFRDGDGDGR